MYIIYKVYQMGRGAAKSLSSLSLGPERKVMCYNRCFVNGYVFLPVLTFVHSKFNIWSYKSPINANIIVVDS